MNRALDPRLGPRDDGFIRVASGFADELADIVHLQVRALGTRLRDRRITLEVTDAATAWLAEQGFDPAYGARPLRRLVQREIGDRLATALLAGSVRDGDTVTVDRGEDGLTLR